MPAAAADGKPHEVATMKPIIDVHTHIFNAMDIPVWGYLCSRVGREHPVRHFLFRLLSRPIARGVRDPLDPKRRTVLTRVLRHLAPAAVGLAEGRHYRAWAQTLSSSTTKIVQEMRDTYEKDNIDLYVPLMVDYEYWFRNSYDVELSQQVDDIHDHVIVPSNGTIHPFVPFDPARELAGRKGMLNPDSLRRHCRRKVTETGSMRLVEKAIEKLGFIGVKLYCALGYKPLDNGSVEEQRERLPLQKKKYAFTGAEYDEVLEKLYTYCVNMEVPITVHCGMGGIESRPGSTKVFGNPSSWKCVLNQEAYKGLRLNLAHFGWGYGKQGYPESWTKRICDMMKKYEFLYADVAHHSVTDPDFFDDVKTSFEAMWADHSDVVGQRLLFGTDWHVLKRVVDYADFKDKYLEIVQGLDPPLQIDDFLGGNALKFLGLLPGGRNRRRLHDFYQRENITPPAWFTATAGGTTTGTGNVPDR